MKALSNMLAGKEHEKEAFIKYFRAMAIDVKNEKKRIGGNFAIAYVVFSRELRDLIREILGPEVVFVLLRMSPEDLRKRVLARHHGEDGAADFMNTLAKLFEPAQENEPRTVEVEITAEMTRAQVVNQIRRKIYLMDDN